MRRGRRTTHRQVAINWKRGVLSATVLLGLTGPAYAVSGVIEINQARALAGGVTPGDTAGFPVTLSQSGSYRLSGNLTVPNERTDAIDVTAAAKQSARERHPDAA